MSEAKRRIMEYIMQAGPSTVEEIITGLRLPSASTDTMRKHLAGLGKAGLLRGDAPKRRMGQTFGSTAKKWSLIDIKEH